MKPDNQPIRNNGPVMDVQRPRSNPAPSEMPTPLDSPIATPDPGQVFGQQPPPEQTQPVVPPPPKKRTGLIAIIITIAAILLIGAGVGGFIWYKNSNKPAPAATVTQTETERVNVEEIDATDAEIDKTLNTLNDSTDVTPSEVSDGPLGL